MSVYPQRIEGTFDPVVGVIRFPRGKVQVDAWLKEEVDPAADMSDLQGFFYDLEDFLTQTVRTILDEAGERGLGVKIEKDRVLLHGSPGYDQYARDAIPLLGACLTAAGAGGEGVVLFLGTKDAGDADCAVTLARKKARVLWLQADPAPPKLPLSADEIVDAVGGAFDERGAVAAALAGVGYPSSEAQDDTEAEDS